MGGRHFSRSEIHGDDDVHKSVGLLRDRNVVGRFPERSVMLEEGFGFFMFAESTSDGVHKPRYTDEIINEYLHGLQSISRIATSNGLTIQRLRPQAFTQRTNPNLGLVLCASGFYPPLRTLIH